MDEKELREALDKILEAGDELAHSKLWPPKKADAELWAAAKTRLEAALAAGRAAVPSERRIYQHHVLCSCLPTRPIGENGCQCRIEFGAAVGQVSEEQIRQLAKEIVIDGPPDGHPWWKEDDNRRSNELEIEWIVEKLNALFRSAHAQSAARKEDA